MTKDEFDNHHIPSAEKFSVEVERRYVAEGEGASYIEIASEYLEELGVDPEDGKPLISLTLLEKIRVEAIARNRLSEKNTTHSLY